MPANPAPLLPREALEQTKRIARAVRESEVAPLVGAGLSMRSGLPAWGALVDRLILAWKEWDDSYCAREAAEDNYVRLVRRTFSDSELAIVSYLRGRIEEREEDLDSFGQFLWSALYSDATGQRAFTPEPNHLHQHLVQMFSGYPRRVWTTNYDDLLEEAARLNGIEAKPIDPDRRQTADKLLVAHLHGFLAPLGRQSGHRSPDHATVVLAEDDYHAIASSVADWTNLGLYRLFEEHRVLILGMSLGDPNLRRVLSTLPEQDPGETPRHFAVMASISADQIGPKRVRPLARGKFADDANDFRRWYWRRRGVEIIELPDYESLSSFLVRLRYESFGGAPGELWTEGARVGYRAVEPWREECQGEARFYLERVVEALNDDFGQQGPSEIVEVGIFLIKPDGLTLELVFRGGGGKRAEPGGRTFSADPDDPVGLAGRVFVSGDVVRVAREDPLHDYGSESAGGTSSPSYRGIISGPVVDWQAGGMPLGVVYLTTSRTDGTLFQMPEMADPGERSLDGLYRALSAFAIALIDRCRNLPK